MSDREILEKAHIDYRCDECDGEGFVIIQDDEIQPRQETCEKCKGTGINIAQLSSALRSHYRKEIEEKLHRLQTGLTLSGERLIKKSDCLAVVKEVLG